MFAGKTAISSATNPQPAKCRNGWINKPMPPAISAMPLTTTNNCGVGKYGGMICRYISGFKKWSVPATTKKIAAKPRKIVRINSTTEANAVLPARKIILKSVSHF